MIICRLQACATHQYASASQTRAFAGALDEEELHAATKGDGVGDIKDTLPGARTASFEIRSKITSNEAYCTTRTQVGRGIGGAMLFRCTVPTAAQLALLHNHLPIG